MVKPHKSIELSKIFHHATALDYNQNSEKILVSTLNEKIQIHSINSEVKDYDVIKIKEEASGHFLLESNNK